MAEEWNAASVHLCSGISANATNASLMKKQLALPLKRPLPNDLNCSPRPFAALPATLQRTFNVLH